MPARKPKCKTCLWWEFYFPTSKTERWGAEPMASAPSEEFYIHLNNGQIVRTRASFYCKLWEDRETERMGK